MWEGLIASTLKGETKKPSIDGNILLFKSAVQGYFCGKVNFLRIYLLPETLGKGDSQ